MRGIEGFFTEDEGRWYARLARSLEGGTFVEIGSWKGRSTSFVGPVCNANGTRLVCVDHWNGSRDSLREKYETTLAVENVEATFRANMKALGITVEVMAVPSLIAANDFADAGIDRIFLDGSHDGPSVAADLNAWPAREARPALALVLRTDHLNFEWHSLQTAFIPVSAADALAASFSEAAADNALACMLS